MKLLCIDKKENEKKIKKNLTCG